MLKKAPANNGVRVYRTTPNICPICTGELKFDMGVWPGKWFWCETCNNHTLVAMIIRIRRYYAKKPNA